MRAILFALATVALLAPATAQRSQNFSYGKTNHFSAPGS